MRFLRSFFWWSLVAAPSFVNAAQDARIDSSELAALRRVAVGETISLARVPISGKGSRQVQLKRIDVYAPDAKVWVVEDAGPREIPRSNWLFFIADDSVVNAPRMSLALAPDGSSVQGTLLGDDGNVYAISSQKERDRIRLTAEFADQAPDGTKMSWSCAGSVPGESVLGQPVGEDKSLSGLTAAKGSPGSRFAVVAFDTDNELMNLKFSNNSTSASNYIAALVTNFNVIYERDLDLTLTLGTVVLRPSSTADPYSAGPSGGGNAQGSQLSEFTNYWNANQSGVQRAFAMMLSGKQPTTNQSSGIAWVLNAGANYCNSSHYSFTQVFRSSGSGAASDTYVLSHELGHNFGADHTHCSNATTGAPSNSGATIDQCYNAEGGGCYSGASACPAASTVNGVTNVRGTLMSYCHIAPAGCGVSNVFANAHRTYLLPTVQANVGFGCFSTSVSNPNLAPNIIRPTSIAVTEDTVANLGGISFTDVDAGTGVLNVTLTVPAGNGSIAATASGGVSIVSGSGSNSLQVSGTLTNLNTWFAAAASNPNYTPAANANGNVTLSILINDNGNSGTGGALSDSDSSTLSIAAVNDAPVNTLPSSFTATEDINISLAGMSVADVDSAANNVSFNLAIPAGQGTFTAVNAGGVSVSGNGSNALTLTGTVTNLASYLANAGNRPTYAPTANNTATVTLTITSNDGGATGGSARTDVDARSISFTAVNDAPSLNAPASQVVSAPGSTPIVGINVSDIDAASGNIGVVLSVNQGLLTASNNDSVTVVSGSNSATLTLLGTVGAFSNFFDNNRVSFNPNGSSGTTTLTINCDDNGNTGSGTSMDCVPDQISLLQALFGNGFE